MERTEILRVQKYLRDTFRLDTIELVPRHNRGDSVEVTVGGEFIGIVFKDEEDGETAYQFQMAILEIDLPPPPGAKT